MHSDGGGVVAFVLILIFSALAFAAVGAGAFEPQRSVSVTVFRSPAEITRAPRPSQVDYEQTSSIRPASQPQRACNRDACEKAYRSFRSSDCTFQPYEGPRRMCTK